MSRPLREHLVASGAVFLVLLIGLSGIHQTTDTVREGQPYSTAAVGELSSSVTIGQTFVASYDGLSAVQVSLGSYGRENSGEVIFRLCTSEDSTENLVRVRFDAAEVEGNVYRDFEFNPIASSGGRSFCFFLEAPAAQSGNAIGVLGSREDLFPHGQAVVSGLEAGDVSDLAFQLQYDPPLPGEIDAFLDRLAANKPSIFGDRWFYIGLCVAYLGLLYPFVLRLARLEPTEGGQG